MSAISANFEKFCFQCIYKFAVNVQVNDIIRLRMDYCDIEFVRLIIPLHVYFNVWHSVLNIRLELLWQTRTKKYLCI